MTNSPNSHQQIQSSTIINANTLYRRSIIVRILTACYSSHNISSLKNTNIRILKPQSIKRNPISLYISFVLVSIPQQKYRYKPVFAIHKRALKGVTPGKDRQMAEINKEARDSFYKELAHRLTAEGYAVEPEAEGLLPVRWHGADLCRITAGGGAQFRESDLAPEGCRGAFDRAVDIAAEVKQYLQLMEAAPVLKAMSLDERYKLLADFNGTVLAGHPTSRGVQFVTWEWSYGRAGVWGGHYFEGNFAKAKRDFALRAELIDRDAIFEPEQLAEVYRAIHETLDGDNAITEARRKLLESAAEQIENAVPDLAQRVDQSNQQELELNMERNGTVQTMC